MKPRHAPPPPTRAYRKAMADMARVYSAPGGESVAEIEARFAAAVDKAAKG